MQPFQIGFLLLLINIYLRFSRVHGLIVHFFLVVNNIPLDVPQIVHSHTKGHLGGFQVLAITDKAALTIYVQVFVWR